MEEVGLNFHLATAAMSALFAILGFAIANSFGFFVPLSKIPLHTISWKDTFQVFFVFLLLQFFLLPLFLLLGIDKKAYSLSNVEAMGWLNITSILLLAGLLMLFLLCFKRGPLFKLFYSKQPALDVLLGCLTWGIAFPSVLVYSLFMQIILGDYFGFSLVDQLAVRQMKGILPYKELFYATTLMVVVLIPMIEEVLFRGFLQSSLRGYLSSWSAIIICSLIFALFHFSLSQGMNNFNILGSLFFLSLFLGFLKERQGNLLAPIAMHATFNGISVVMVLNSLN